MTRPCPDCSARPGFVWRELVEVMCTNCVGLGVVGERFLKDRVALFAGDCLDVLERMEPDSVDSVVCDPPYHLTSIVKRFGADDAAPAKVGKTGAYARASAGFMGKKWDGGGVAFEASTWARVLRVLKPGGHLVAFSGTRTYHRMTTAIEDAGFEIRDQLAWAFGVGFPKSHNLPGGLGTALKPAWEPICLARKPLSEATIAANVLKWGTGALNIDGCRVGVRERPKITDAKHNGHTHNTYGAPSGGGKLLPDARWPANVVHDGSPEVLAGFPETPGQQASVNGREPSSKTKNVLGLYNERTTFEPRGDSGSAARFFYTAKADSFDRLASKHPTVKPVDLIQWLVRLVTPPKGLILDCFAGTGTTGEAAYREGMRAVLIEREADYLDDIRRRMGLVLAGPDERSRSIAKLQKPVPIGPLFDGIE